MGKYAKNKRKRTPLEWLVLALAVILVLLVMICIFLERVTDRPEPTLPQVQTTPVEGTGEIALQNTAADTTSAESDETEFTAPPATVAADSPSTEAPNSPTMEAPTPATEAPNSPTTETPTPVTEAPNSPTTETTNTPTTQETSPQPVELQLPIVLQEGLTITDIDKYAGIYMEDGSDEMVSNLLMIQVENTTGKDLYLAQIKLEYGNKTAEFQVTNLPNGAKAVLLERQRMSYTAQLPQNASAENVAFTTEFSMFADQLEVNALDGVINVKNISGKDIPEDIYVYYKNYAGNLYYGGITYRIQIDGGLKAGEIRQIMASHYIQSSSKLLMVTIGG